jgi:potassium-transporting ATPase KdpC subunit
VAYPFAVTGIAQLLLPHQGNGSLIYKDGRPVGSTLIGQPFDDPKYFWSKPSATAPFFRFDLVTASGSRLIPHISPAAAVYQVGRIAQIRGVEEAVVQQLVARHTEGRQLGLLSERRVNVLLLNLELDEISSRPRLTGSPRFPRITGD